VKNPYFRLRVNKADWFAFGFCREGSIKQRNYSRFNGCGDHGCYVMDNSGWIYADKSDDNYKKIGFDVNDNDIVLVAYDHCSSILTIMNQTSWKKV
jgi:hypothetical protein